MRQCQNQQRQQQYLQTVQYNKLDEIKQFNTYQEKKFSEGFSKVVRHAHRAIQQQQIRFTDVINFFFFLDMYMKQQIQRKVQDTTTILPVSKKDQKE